jgi:uncharacterized protein
MKRCSCILIAGLIIASAVHAQDRMSDLDRIMRHPVGIQETINPLNTNTPITVKHRSLFARYNPFTLTATGLMLFYQRVVSPQISASCIYTRSCSNFAKQGIQEFGLIKGVFLAADRLLRCNRSCENDHPAYAFTNGAKIIDEPLIYKKVK